MTAPAIQPVLQQSELIGLLNATQPFEQQNKSDKS